MSNGQWPSLPHLYWRRGGLGRWILSAGCCAMMSSGVLPRRADIAAANFDDGTTGLFVIEPAGTGAVVPDPTGSGHGNVVVLRYVADTTPGLLRSAVIYPPTVKLGLGSTFYFSGDLYVPDTTFNLANQNVARRLVLFRGASGLLQNDSTDAFVLINLAACGVTVQWSDGWKTGWTLCRAQPDPGRWHRLETQVTMNHAVSSTDGVIRLWIDGKLVYQDLTVRLTDPRAKGQPVWREWAIGVDRNSADFGSVPDISEGGSISEVRYWDNVTFTTTRKTASER